MSQRLNEYLAGEAADYLEQLDWLLSEEAAPDMGRLLRLATGVRGSIELAGGGAIARVALRLEEALGAISAGSLAWSEEVRHLSRRTVAEIQSLIATLDQWGYREEQQAQAAIDHWDNILSAETAEVHPPVPIEMLYYDDAGPHILYAPPLDAAPIGVVAIETLLFRGEAALQEARRLRPAFEELTRGQVVPVGPLASLVDELFDLLDLSLSSDAPEA